MKDYVYRTSVGDMSSVHASAVEPIRSMANGSCTYTLAVDCVLEVTSSPGVPILRWAKPYKIVLAKEQFVEYYIFLPFKVIM